MTARAEWEWLRQAAVEHDAAPLRLIVGAGTCGRARGAGAVLAALEHEVKARGLAAEVVAGGCNGMCFAQVIVTPTSGGQAKVVYGGITVDTVPTLLDGIGSGDVQESAEAGDGIRLILRFAQNDRGEAQDYREQPQDDREQPAFLVGQRRLLTRDLGTIDPESIDDYLAHDGYATLARVLDELPPEQVIAEVKASNLLGRGGAYFPTGVKWEGARAARGEPKWLVVNAEEGEPGVFKDRHLLEGDPHRVIEGMLIAAYAVGASRGIFYVNGQAHLAQARVSRALDQARARHLIGDEILGSPFSFQVEIRHGSGGYILGEETALLESIEGRRAMPRVRPPFPVESGLWGKPTVINNAESLATVRSVLELGGAEFACLGLPGASGTKLIGLSGNVTRPGLAEVEFGTTMRQLVEGIGGGVPDGRALKAVLIGGPSGVFVPASALDEPIQPRGAVPPGTGGWVVLDEDQSIAAAARQMTEFNMAESCGKCTPCREGTVRLVGLLDRVLDGTAATDDLDEIRALDEVVEFGSLCGLGQMAPRPIQSAMEHFPDEFAVPAYR